MKKSISKPEMETIYHIVMKADGFEPEMVSGTIRQLTEVLAFLLHVGCYERQPETIDELLAELNGIDLPGYPASVHGEPTFSLAN